METEVELLELLIKAECKTRTAFAEKIGMSRQNINYHLREAEKNNGNLSKAFKQVLKYHDLDLYRFKRKPTNDFYENALTASVAAEPETPIMNSQMKINELLERENQLLKNEILLLKKLKEVEQERDELKAQVPQSKKEGRRHSA